MTQRRNRILARLNRRSSNLMRSSALIKVPSVILMSIVLSCAQAGRKPPAGDATKKTIQPAEPAEQQKPDQKDADAVKLGTTLVTVPVIASYRNGIYIRDLNDFTSDRSVLKRAIQQTRPGKGTRLYDAFRVALQNLSNEDGRKAIVRFTDGVDWHSLSTTDVDNLRALEESGVIVYPIRYETRAETEALIRQQERQGRLPDLGVIFGDPTRTTPTVPGSDPRPDGRTDRKDPYGIPVPPIVIPQPRRTPYPGGRYPDDRYPDPRSPDPRSSDPRSPDPRFPGDNRFPDDRFPDNRNPTSGRSGTRVDSTSVLLDALYSLADKYLNDLATVSGGKLH